MLAFDNFYRPGVAFELDFMDSNPLKHDHTIPESAVNLHLIYISQVSSHQVWSIIKQTLPSTTGQPRAGNSQPASGRVH